jgi:hypothetical protein
VLPTRTHNALRDLLPDEQKGTIQLAAILRLANALDAKHDGHIRRIQIENSELTAKFNRRQHNDGFSRTPLGAAHNQALVIAAEGYSALVPSAQTIAAERHLLETVLHRPVLIKPLKQTPRA